MKPRFRITIMSNLVNDTQLVGWVSKHWGWEISSRDKQVHVSMDAYMMAVGIEVAPLQSYDEIQKIIEHYKVTDEPLSNYPKAVFDIQGVYQFEKFKHGSAGR